MVITIIVYKGAYLNVWYLQVKIKKNLNALKESTTKRLNKNEFIENIENIENTVADDPGNVASAIDGTATMEFY